MNDGARPDTSIDGASGSYELVLEAGRVDANYWADLWRYRELFLALAWRDIAVRYKQTVLGFAWAVIRPLALTLALSYAFGRIARMADDVSAPYTLFVLAGVLPWQFLSAAVVESSNSLIVNANLMSKVYFPRMLAPLSAVGVVLFDFVMSLVIVAGLFAWYRYGLTWRVALLPVFALWAFFAALGPGLLLAALNVRYRDFRYVIPFLVQFGVFVSPVGFASSKFVSPAWRPLYGLNPVVGPIDGFRWCLLGAEFPLDLASIATGVVTTLVLLAVGVSVFRRMEREFADIV